MEFESSATQQLSAIGAARRARPARFSSARGWLLAAGVLALLASLALIRVDAAFAAGEAPTVETGAASAVTQTSATLEGSVNPNGAEVTSCEVEYGPSEAYGSQAPCESLPATGTSAEGVSAPVAGLSADTTYHYRILAASENGTGYGGDGTFTTLPEAPAVVTGSVSSLGEVSAKLNGTVDPNGAEVTNCHFAYGRTEAYGSSASCASLPPLGSTPVAVSAAIAGLAPGTTYHYRLFATNVTGTGEGSDQSFTTPSPTLPELGRCLVVAAHNAKYATSSCTRLSTGEDKGGYEWQPWPALKNGFSFGGRKGVARFESVGGAAVKCTGEARIEGEYTGPQTASAAVQFTECGYHGGCHSEGASANEIRTEQLVAHLGVIAAGLKPSIGWSFHPASGSVLASFFCGAIPVTVSGAVIVPVTPIDKMSTDFTLKFKELAGRQQPESFEGIPKEVLTLQSPFGEEQGGLKLESGNLNEEAVEIKAIS